MKIIKYNKSQFDHLDLLHSENLFNTLYFFIYKTETENVIIKNRLYTIHNTLNVTLNIANGTKTNVNIESITKNPIT